MKTKILIAALLASTVMTAAAAQSGEQHERPDFATLDINGDGRVTLEEMQAQGEARFATMDTDGDGVLSLEELNAAAAARSAERTAKMLERLDENGDGMLQQSEMQPRGGDRLERMFSHLDADEDGAIDADEFEAAKERMGERRGGRRGEGGGRHGEGHGPRGRG